MDEQRLPIPENELQRLVSLYKLDIDRLRHELDLYKETTRKVAHDIRGPLSGIIGLSSILEEEKQGKVSDELKTYIQMILESSRSLINFSEELLTKDENELNGTRFNLIHFKEELLKLYQPQATCKSITLKVIVLNGLQDGMFSKNKLIHIAGNLICNAIKFTPSGGNVDVILQLQSILNKTTLKITVSDTGKGLDDKQIKGIFALEGITTPGTQGETGYGYGLTIIKNLTEELKAHLQVHSEEGQGTTFNVIVPETV